MSLLIRLSSEVNDEPFIKLKNSEIVSALGSNILEVQNLARIIAARRGIQIVEDSKNKEK